MNEVSFGSTVDKGLGFNGFLFLWLSHRIGKEMFIDWAPILANNTEEMVSDLDIEAGRFTENPPSLIPVWG